MINYNDRLGISNPASLPAWRRPLVVDERPCFGRRIVIADAPPLVDGLPAGPPKPGWTFGVAPPCRRR